MASDANVLWCYGLVSEQPGDFSASLVRDELKKFNKALPVTLRVNSPGGAVSEGVAIASQLNEWRAGVRVVVDGLAASISSYLMTVGDQTLIAPDAMAMVHNAWTVAIGDHSEMRKAGDVLETISGTLASAYARKTGRPVAEIKKMMDVETWLTSAGCVELGLADAIVGDDRAERSVAALQRRLDSFAMVR